MMDLNPYEELGVERDADETTIRRAYRQKAKAAHPDAGGTEEAFAKVSTSLAVLTTPSRRRTFDETGLVEDQKPDNDRASALQIVEMKIGDVVNAYITSGFRPEHDPRRQNIPALIIGKIQQEIYQARDGIKGGENVLAYLKDVGRRFKLKAGPAAMPEGDPIVRGFKAQVDRAEQQLSDLRASIRVRELAIKIVEGYSFEQEQSIFAHSYAYQMAEQYGDGT